MEGSTRREAAVLVPIFRGDAEDLRLVLIRRADRGVHGAQLAFPGGRREPHDVSLFETALREAEEEIGLRRESVKRLADLPAIETRTTGFRIAPFLVRIQRPEEWQADPSEVAEVMEVPLAEMARPEAHGEAVEQFPNWTAPQRIAFYRVGPYRLWGASYRIFHPLLPRLMAGEWEA